MGAPSAWPQPLKTLVGVMLAANQPMFVVWGPERILLYNDGYAPILADRHPSALGRPFFEVWPETRTELTPLFEQVFAGEPVHMDDIELYLDRPGRPREAHFAFSYTPVRNEHDAVVGLFCPCAETTDQVLGNRGRAAAAERQHRVFQQMPGFVAVLAGPTHVFDYVNDAYVEVAGARDFVGRAVRDVFPDLEGQGFYELLDNVYATGEPFAARAMPIRFERADGDRFVDFLYQPIRDEGGAVTGIFVGGYDVTERRRAEDALRESEARYRTLFDSIESGFCVVEVSFDGRIDYRVVEANPAFERQTGLGGAQGQWLRAFAPALEEHWFETYGRIARTGVAERFESGSAALGRWFDVYAFRVGAPGERRVAILFNDISARRNAEERLRELNETLEAQVAERTAERDRMWNTSPDLMVVIDFAGVFRHVNPAWTTLLGYSREELEGHHVNEFVLPDDHAATVDAYQLAAVGGRPRIENRYRHKDGSTRWISWTAAPAGDVTYATGRDVTAEKEREAELAQAQEALRQAQKMEAVGQLTGGIAHDFNNMLAVVIGSLDLLGRRLGGADARAKRYVDAAADGARRAALLTQRLLAFSRQQPLRPEPIDANKLVAGMSELIRGSLGSDIRLETVLASGLWRTHADPNQLENVLLNLAVNARDAMPDGGRLTIETQNAYLDARYTAAHLGVPAGQYVMIAVTDTGSGMPAAVIAKAFDPFFTTKAIGKGTGLGLSQVYGFVKQSGGHVKIYSESGQGTTVKVYLPRLIGAGQGGPEADAATALPLGEAQEVILVVEDEAAVRQFSVDALAELGYRVLEADGAAAALQALDAQPEIALLFTDVVMPDVNGRKLADEARRRRPDLKVLFTTGYTRNAVVHNGVLDPGVALIGKPFTIEELAAKVRDVLDAVPARIGAEAS